MYTKKIVLFKNIFMYGVQEENTGFGVQTNATFMSTMWSFFGLAIFIAALGAFSGEFILRATGFWVPYIAFMGMMFTSGMWINSKAKLPMFALFAFLSGTVMYPTLAFAGATGQIGEVIKAFIAGGLTFFIAAVWGFTTQKDLSGWGNFLTMAMFGMFGIAMISMIGGGLLNIELLQFSSTMSYVYSAISVLLFTAFTSYDIQNIKKGLYSSPMEAAFHMYFNLYIIIQHMMNLFMFSDD